MGISGASTPTSRAASLRLAGAVAAAVLLVAACGSSDGTASERTTAAPPDIAADTAPAPVVTAPAADVGAPLELCDDVPVVTTDVIGDRLGGQHPDDVFMGVVRTYADEHPDTFGGLWIDNEAGGTVVVAFTDDLDRHRDALAGRAPSPDDAVGVEPRPSIVDDRPIGEWDQPFDVVGVTFSEAQLSDAQDAMWPILSDAGVAVDGLGTDIRRNRVSISLVEPTEDDLVDLAGVLPVDRVCIDGALVDPDRPRFEPGDELDVIVDVDSSDPVACAGMTFPLDALTDPLRLADSDHDGVKDALDQALSTAEGQFWPAEDWIVASATDDAVTLVHVDEDSVSFMSFESTRAGWSWRGSTSSPECPVRTELPEGLSEVDWELDPTAAVDPEGTTFQVLATERTCASGREMGDRLLGPQVVETDDAVLVAFAAVPPVGGQDCQGNPSTPVTVELSEPLGDREISDGRTVAADIRDLLPS